VEKSKLFEDIINENALVEYFRLYNNLTTEIGIFYDKLFGLKSILRLIEANKNPTRSLEDVYADIDISVNRIQELLSEMREKEDSLIFIVDSVSENILPLNHEQFARSYMARKAEALRSLMNSDESLTQIKTDIIDQINRVNKRNQATRKWNGYKTDINILNKELSHIDNIVREYAEKADNKFHFNPSLIQIMNTQ
jgi:hypothetical protein